VYGYEITYQGVELPILVGGVSVDDPYAKMVYDLVAKHIATSGAGTYTFVMNDVDEYLRHEIFEAQHMTTYDVHGIRTSYRSVTGIPMLASFGVESVSTGFGFNLAWNDNDGRMNIDPVAFAALEADQFMSFVQSYLDVEYDEEDQPWYMELLSIVLKIIAIVLVVFTVVIGIQAVAAAMAAGSFTAGIAAFNAVLAGAGLTTTAYGAFAGLVIGVLNVAGALMTLPLLGSIQEAHEAVEKPEDIRTKVGIADETYWTWHDSDKPENVIKSVLEQGKP
jgi:ABC-type multidrug transport system fused ATPase/permease subunit